VAALEASGWSCRIAPLGSDPLDREALRVLCDPRACYACVLSEEEEEEDGEDGEEEEPVFSPVSRRVVGRLVRLVAAGHSCGVTRVRAGRITTSGVRALCQPGFCFLCQTRRILPDQGSVLRLAPTLVTGLAAARARGEACALTSLPTGPEPGATCEAAVCVRCRPGRRLPDLLPDGAREAARPVGRRLVTRARRLVKQGFACALTVHRSTEIDAPGLQMVCGPGGAVCFLCRGPGAELALDVEAVPVGPKLLAGLGRRLGAGSHCAVTLQGRAAVEGEGLEVECGEVCTVCDRGPQG
jgi:hypothetical protein